MSDRHALTALLGRVREAHRSNRELDIALECALPNVKLGEYNHRPSNARGKVTCNYPNGRSSTYNPRRFTHSVDDAMELVGRMLPGWTVDHLGQNSLHAGDPWSCRLAIYFGNDPSRTRSAFAYSEYQTAPLSIIAATLIALIEQAAP